MPDLSKDYENAGFAGSLEFGNKPALLIIDMVDAYLNPKSPLYLETAEKALHQTTKLLAAFSAKNLPIFMTTVHYTKGMKEAGLFAKKAPVIRCFEDGSEFAKMPTVLSNCDDYTLIKKHYPSAYFGTDLSTMLTIQKVDSVVITGYSTSGCVRASALDTLQYGFSPFVVSDAVADRDTAPHESNLFDMKAKYAEVVTTDEILGLI